LSEILKTFQRQFGYLSRQKRQTGQTEKIRLDFITKPAREKRIRRSKAMIIFGGIDGTGEWGNDGYEATFENSHVNILYKFWNEGPKIYKRGPTTLDNKLDNWTALQAYRIYTFVTEHWRNAGKKAIFLAGYSRGGAAVIEVAKWLKADGIPVECLILFDPVDRTGQVGFPWRDTPIASTVKHVIYAQRSYLAKSRESFGNCGREYEDRSKTRLDFNVFFCTHGGVGGVPWTKPAEGFINENFPDFMTRVTVEQDRFGAQKVQRWAWNLIFEDIENCRRRLAEKDRTTPNPDFQIPSQPGFPLNGGGGNGRKIHVVRPGDWLSKIAQTYYGDINKWRTIYEVPENKRTIGPNPDLIQPGQRLIIP
jgi:hypothetical protein